MDTAEYYKSLFERHMADSNRYQAMLFHSWTALRQQTKGMQRQARRIKKLKAQVLALGGKL